MSSVIKSRHSNKDRIFSNLISGGAAITTSDTVDLPEQTIALYVSVAGSVKVTFIDGSVVTYPNLIAGRHMLRVSRVWFNGTTATGLIAEY